MVFSRAPLNGKRRLPPSASAAADPLAAVLRDAARQTDDADVRAWLRGLMNGESAAALTTTAASANGERSTPGRKSAAAGL
jgi:hypothetical protein